VKNQIVTLAPAGIAAYEEGSANRPDGENERVWLQEAAVWLENYLPEPSPERITRALADDVRVTRTIHATAAKVTIALWWLALIENNECLKFRLLELSAQVLPVTTRRLLATRGESEKNLAEQLKVCKDQKFIERLKFVEESDRTLLTEELRETLKQGGPILELIMEPYIKIK
jgi:hypothetical protein